MTNRQNSAKRTLISFTIAFSIALVTIFIQKTKKEKMAHKQNLEANSANKAAFMLKK